MKRLIWVLGDLALTVAAWYVLACVMAGAFIFGLIEYKDTPFRTRRRVLYSSKGYLYDPVTRVRVKSNVWPKEIN